MRKAFKDRDAAHVSHPNWLEADSIKFSSRYAHCVTLEPKGAVEAWGKLSEDTFAIEIARLPSILHRALKRELFKRTNRPNS